MAENRATTVVTRSVPTFTRLLLVVKAGGRCEFDGCNDYVFEHHLTLSERVFGELAHIVAFRQDGPRGKDPKRTKAIHDIGNLMLLCPKCHKEVDDDEETYTRAVLMQHKERHEQRIRFLTSLAPECKTTVLTLKAKVGGAPVEIPFPHIVAAVAPMYPKCPQSELIDLTAFDDRDDGFYTPCLLEIQRRINRIFASDLKGDRPEHISVFALAPIPLLVYLGSLLSSKVPTDVYQRHRDTEDWTWKTGGEPIDYSWKVRRRGSRIGNVALLLSLSGKIDIRSLPRAIDKSYWVYDLTLKNATPTPTFLRLKQDLDNFKEAYQRCLRFILAKHGQIARLHLFPAVPAPVAVLCGRELLPKTDPVVLVYDRDKSKGGFVPTIEVNSK